MLRNDDIPPEPIEQLIPEPKPSSLYRLNRIRSNDRAATDDHINLTSDAYDLSSLPIISFPMPQPEESVEEETVPSQTEETSGTDADEGKEEVKITPSIIAFPQIGVPENNTATPEIPTVVGANPLSQSPLIWLKPRLLWIP